VVNLYKLYIVSPGMEAIIESNMRSKAADYGFLLMNSRSAADVVLSGSAGVLKKEGFPFDSCTAFMPST
jgi:hypothetical protein